jgi:hypothetical protein
MFQVYDLDHPGFLPLKAAFHLPVEFLARLVFKQEICYNSHNQLRSGLRFGPVLT